MSRPRPPVPKPKSRRAAKKAPPISRLRAPDGVSLPEWQIALRRQFGRQQAFQLTNMGDAPLFSDFRVVNPASGSRHRVTIRGLTPGENRCECGDFATNALGTCKHIEFVLARLERKRGAKAALRRGYASDGSEIWLQHGDERRVRLRPGAGIPARLRQAAEALFDSADGWRLPNARLHQLDGFVASATRLRHPLSVDPVVSRFVSEALGTAQRRAELARLYPQGAASPALRDLLQVPMFPYQAEGALFAVTAGRALIADEMGLGKTVQAIAAAELWRRHFAAQRVLIVCPMSLKAQWAHELQRFSGDAARIVEGTATERAAHYAAPDTIKIASYDSLTRDIDLANAWCPDVLIVDEAQRVKNWDTLAARALKRLDSRYTVVLTGTPLENKLEELLSVVQLVDRHRLGPTWRFLHEHQLRDDAGRVIGYRQLDRIGETLAPILIRRRKREVLEQLPERRDRNLFVALAPLQRALHDEQADIVARIVARWRKQRRLSEADQKRLQAALQKMRMVCNSSFLLDPDTEDGEKIPELLVWLQARLAEAGAKAVIFSAWLGTHALIGRELTRLGIGHVHFNGSVTARERARRVEQFRTDPDCRVFLGTDAGSVGLNLQHAASLIVNMDLPWNPAVLEQRIGRVYRLGQERAVEVLNLIASASIEENMLGLLRFKRALFDGALEGGESEIRLEGTRLSRFMQSVDALTGNEVPTASSASGADASGAGVLLDEIEDPVVSTPEPTVEDGRTAQASTRGTQPAPTPARVQSLPGVPLPIDVPSLLHLAGTWLTQVAATLGEPRSGPSVEHEPASGRAFLRLPLPEPELLRGLSGLLQTLVSGAQEAPTAMERTLPVVDGNGGLARDIDPSRNGSLFEAADGRSGERIASADSNLRGEKP